MAIETFPACLHESNRPKPGDITEAELTQLSFGVRALTDVMNMITSGFGAGARWQLQRYNGNLELENPGEIHVVAVSREGMTEVAARLLGFHMLENWGIIRPMVVPDELPAHTDGTVRFDHPTPNRVLDFADRLLTLDGTPYTPEPS
jgi:hypothetical protein